MMCKEEGGYARELTLPGVQLVATVGEGGYWRGLRVSSGARGLSRGTIVV